MAEIFLVRHGQAAFGTDNYDRLTDTGWEQSRLLGDYFADLELGFDAVFTGCMRRHRETLQGISEKLGQQPKATEHEGLNEYNFLGLLELYVPQQGLQVNLKDSREFYRCLRDALLAWSRGEVEGVSESWDEFEARIADTMNAISAAKGKVLVVSSGGVSSAIMRRALNLDVPTMVELNLQARNTCVSRYFTKNGQFKLNTFNAVPHLENSRNRHMITYT